jgi:hypothetical protein
MAKKSRVGVRNLIEAVHYPQPLYRPPNIACKIKIIDNRGLRVAYPLNLVKCTNDTSIKHQFGDLGFERASLFGRVTIIHFDVSLLLLFLSLLNGYVPRWPPNAPRSCFPETYATIISSRS